MEGIFNSGLGLAVFLLGMGAPREPQRQVDEIQQEAPGQGSAAPLSTTPSPNGSVAPSLRAMPSTASRDVPNDISLRLAQSGRAAWDAFQCAGFAAAMHDKEAFDGVFAHGFSSAHLFVNALQKERIKRVHFEREIPSPMRASLEGPSADFVAGRVYQTALESAVYAVETGAAVLNRDRKVEPGSNAYGALRNDVASSLFETSGCHDLPNQP
jgi:hypothetical protein